MYIKIVKDDGVFYWFAYVACIKLEVNGWDNLK